MKEETVPLVYGRALIEAAVEKGELDRVHEEVIVLESMLLERRGAYRPFFESPRIGVAEKQRVIESAFRGRFSDLLVNFLLVLLRRKRLQFLVAMLGVFRSLYDENAGIVRARVLSAVKLAESTRAELQSKLERMLAKRIVIEPTEDPDVLGGLIVRYTGMVADGSLRTALRKVRAEMLTPKLGSQLFHEDQR
jgi:F-type H+-transporting ATPase subunit delta